MTPMVPMILVKPEALTAEERWKALSGRDRWAILCTFFRAVGLMAPR